MVRTKVIANVYVNFMYVCATVHEFSMFVLYMDAMEDPDICLGGTI